jgi:acyl dehydratase
MTLVSISQVHVGLELPAQEFIFTRADLIKYAGASGDFNIIHWNERVAREVGLPSVIAHGMLTMGTAIRVVTDWLGDPGKVIEYSARFTRPIPVPDTDEGTSIKVSAKVTELLENDQAVITISAIHNEVTVLAKTVATVQLAP